eukprot:2952386-Alexandrium_andersonii.AAC.1
MSASLVGSEMCIRDRHGPKRAIPDWKRRLRSPLRSVSGTPRASRPPGEPSARVPVSYTHLRAHETSAHL